MFGFIFIINLVCNLWQICKMNSTELLQSGKKGEKEPKHLIPATIMGLLSLAIGYGVSISARLDSMIFFKFPIAIIFVVIGTYFLFTAGTIQYLKHLKKNPAFYYRKDNFVTISGMLYRMKKSAASLVNICLFSTMLIVMYYKQISEGLEDQDSFHIMKQVGMSDRDIHDTIKKQILLVFALPAAVAILHICAALPMLINLMYALNLYQTMSTIFSTVIVTCAFLAFYIYSYFQTARTYYKIIS